MRRVPRLLLVNGQKGRLQIISSAVQSAREAASSDPPLLHLLAGSANFKLWPLQSPHPSLFYGSPRLLFDA